MQEFERAVAARPEYAWVFAGDGWFNVAEIARGLGVSRKIVTDWCRDSAFPGALYYGDNVGYRIPRSGLIEFLAKRLSGQQNAG
jgi:hypothetical protein